MSEDVDVASALWRRLLPSVAGDAGAQDAVEDPESVMAFKELARALQERQLLQPQRQQQPDNVYLGEDGAVYPKLDRAQMDFAVNPGFVSFRQPEFKEEEVRSAAAEGMYFIRYSTPSPYL